MEPIYKNLANFTLSPQRKSEMKLAYGHLFCFELLDNILSYLPEKNKYGYDRVESITLWSRISQVCQGFRWWVFCSEKGPFKLSEHAVIHLIIRTPSNMSTIRCFLGVLNQEKIKQVDAAFKYIENPDDYPELNVISKISPYVKNYKGHSLIDMVISKMSTSYNARPLLKMVFNKMSPVELANHILVKQNINYENYIKLFDLLFDEIREKTGNEILAQAALQPLLGNLLCVNNSYSVSLFYEWIQKKGMEFNIENLTYCFSNDFSKLQEDKLLPIIEKIINLNPEIMDQATPGGDRLIHILLKGQKKTSTLEMYLELILNELPLEIKAKDCEGKSTISYLFENHNGIIVDTENNNPYSEPKHDYTFLTKTYFTSDVLWDIREECFQTILQHIKKERLNFFKSPSTQAQAFLLRIKELFAEEDSFIEWLISPYGKDKECFMDHLANWAYTLAYEMNHRLAKIFSDVSNWDEIRENFSKYPDLKKSLQLKFFGENIRSNYDFDKDFSLMNQFFDSNWVNFIDREGNTLLHHLFSIKTTRYNASNIKATIVYMVDRGFDPYLKNNAGETVMDLAIKNQWNDFLPLLS